MANLVCRQSQYLMVWGALKYKLKMSLQALSNSLAFTLDDATQIK